MESVRVWRPQHVGEDVDNGMLCGIIGSFTTRVSVDETKERESGDGVGRVSGVRNFHMLESAAELEQEGGLVRPRLRLNGVEAESAMVYKRDHKEVM